MREAQDVRHATEGDTASSIRVCAAKTFKCCGGLKEPQEVVGQLEEQRAERADRG